LAIWACRPIYSWCQRPRSYAFALMGEGYTSAKVTLIFLNFTDSYLSGPLLVMLARRRWNSRAAVDCIRTDQHNVSSLVIKRSLIC
jgi:hypothetical protein